MVKAWKLNPKGKLQSRISAHIEFDQKLLLAVMLECTWLALPFKICVPPEETQEEDRSVPLQPYRQFKTAYPDLVMCARYYAYI